LANEEADGELSVLGTSSNKEKVIKFSPGVTAPGNRPLPPPKPKVLETTFTYYYFILGSGTDSCLFD
jgi:hypothetical protein